MYKSSTKCINITAPAIHKLSRILQTTKKDSFSLSVKNAGCIGTVYSLELIYSNKYMQYFCNKKNLIPTKFTKDNINVFINPIHKNMLYNTTIDYLLEDYNNNLFNSQFVFYQDINSTEKHCHCQPIIGQVMTTCLKV